MHRFLPRAAALSSCALVVLSCFGPAAAADSAPYRLTEDIVFGHKDGLALTFDVLEPTENPKGLGVILVSSGGWHSSKSDIPAENEKRIKQEHWVQGLLKGGYTIFITRHGSGPRDTVPEMVGDIRRAVRFVRLHAADYHVDPNRLGITSGSSGGHLSLMVALAGDDGRADAEDPVERVSSRVQTVVAWFPPTDLINWNAPNGYHMIEKLRPQLFEEMFGKVTDVEAQLKSMSPIEFVTTDDPPLLLIHGDRDTTVPVQQSKVLAAKYEQVGLPIKLVVHPGGRHSYWPGIMDQYPAVWAFFDEHLKPAATADAATAKEPAAK